MVKNPPSRAADQASVLGWRTKIPSATGQLESLQVTREEPEHHSGDKTDSIPKQLGILPSNGRNYRIVFNILLVSLLSVHLYHSVCSQQQS